MTETIYAFSVVTLFPAMIDAFANVGIVSRAAARGIVRIETHDPRSFTANGRGQVDDAPYGGGPGMVMSVPPLRAAIKAARHGMDADALVAYLSPQGRRLDQSLVADLATRRNLILVAGRYEGIDERVIERDIDIEISLGDFVMSGGEVAAMAVIDAVVRLLPGALGSDLSADMDSFADGLLEYPQYTRPEIVDDQSVPDVLLSGNHREIERWRREQSVARTAQKRPDLLARADLSDDERDRNRKSPR